MAYTTIDDPSAHFQTQLYTGNASTLSVTFDGNSDMQPDLVWIKARASKSHALHDSSRGAGQRLSSDSVGAEATASSSVTSFDSDGFSLGSNNTENDSESYVCWNWKANGGTTSSNTSGTITTTVQANTDAGFSIVTWTGNGSNATMGHGLGTTPHFIITKSRTTTNDWNVYHKDMNSAPYNYIIYLHLDSAPSAATGSWGTSSSDINSSTFYMKYWINYNSASMLAYCFTSKQGFSKFGKYTGNGNANGTFVYTGFKPAVIILKKLATENWYILDTARDEYNIAYKRLFPNLNLTEYVNLDILDLYSNGFKIRTSSTVVNSSGTEYIYCAWAENPFVTSTGIPTTAR